MEGFPDAKAHQTLGKVYCVHPSAEERFFLRMLLYEMKSPCSFEELRIVRCSVCATYREACNRRGMFDSDECWRETLEETSVQHSSSKLRMLLATMLNWSNPLDPMALWEEFNHQLSENNLFHYRRRLGNMHLDANNEIFNQALIDLEEKILSVGGKLLQDYSLLAGNREISDHPLEVLFEQNHDVQYLENSVTENVTKLTDD